MFTSVLPPASVVAELDDLLVPRRAATTDLRWRSPDGWHLTTSFMESVPDSHYDRLVEELTVPPTGPGLSSWVAGASPSPHAARPRSSGWLPPAPTTDFQRSPDAAARRPTTGVAVDGATFVGHLTLARHNRGIDAGRWLGVFDSFPGWSWTADELVLIESHQVGRRYEVVERFPLR